MNDDNIAISWFQRLQKLLLWEGEIDLADVLLIAKEGEEERLELLKQAEEDCKMLELASKLNASLAAQVERLGAQLALHIVVD